MIPRFNLDWIARSIGLSRERERERDHRAAQRGKGRWATRQVANTPAPGAVRRGVAWRGAWGVGRGGERLAAVCAPRVDVRGTAGYWGVRWIWKAAPTHTGAGDKVGATHTLCAHPEAKPGVDAGGRTRRARAVACCVPVSLAARAARHVALVAAAALAGP